MDGRCDPGLVVHGRSDRGEEPVLELGGGQPGPAGVPARILAVLAVLADELGNLLDQVDVAREC